ncbi:MAG TPA: shikimate dehydrogenase [Caulobacteraceae bacterium]
MKKGITAATRLAGVVGLPISHSLSPVLFNAWLAAAAIDAVYLAFSPSEEGFGRFVAGVCEGAALGLNVTAPFKEAALALPGRHASPRADRAGAANLLVFAADGSIAADNTDGVGLMMALAKASGEWKPANGPAVILGAGGAARAAAAALLEAGASQVRIIGRRPGAAARLANWFDAGVKAVGSDKVESALTDANLVINATPQGQGGQDAPTIPLEAAPRAAVVMDMVYRPVHTAFLERAQRLGHPTVDGLAMLIGQAEPSFAALFGAPPPRIDVRSLALAVIARST